MRGVRRCPHRGVWAPAPRSAGPGGVAAGPGPGASLASVTRVARVRRPVADRLPVDRERERGPIAEQDRADPVRLGVVISWCGPSRSATPRDRRSLGSPRRGESGHERSQAVGASQAKHGDLWWCRVVAVECEDVELGVWTDVDDGETELFVLLIARDTGLEDLGVEGVQPVRVAGEDRDMVETVEQHERLGVFGLAWKGWLGHDQPIAEVVQRIFVEYLDGNGDRAIAEGPIAGSAAPRQPHDVPLPPCCLGNPSSTAGSLTNPHAPKAAHPPFPGRPTTPRPWAIVPVRVAAPPANSTADELAGQGRGGGGRGDRSDPRTPRGRTGWPARPPLSVAATRCRALFHTISSTSPALNPTSAPNGAGKRRCRHAPYEPDGPAKCSIPPGAARTVLSGV